MSHLPARPSLRLCGLLNVGFAMAGILCIAPGYLTAVIHPAARGRCPRREEAVLLILDHRWNTRRRKSSVPRPNAPI